jgi:hypothetical protein
MPSAVDLLADPSVTAREAVNAQASSKERESATGIDVTTFLMDVVKSNKLDFDLASNIVSGSITRTMGGASTIQVTVSDHDRVLLKSALWDYAIDVNIDGHFFRLVQISKQDDDLTLTFEDRIVALLREHNSHEKTARNKMTRAEFVQSLSQRVKEHPIRFFCPELHKTQPIKRRRMTDTERKVRRHPGLEKSVKIRMTYYEPARSIGTRGPQGLPGPSQFIPGSKHVGAYATKQQLDTAERVLDTGYGEGANQKCLITGMMVAIQESMLNPAATNGVHVGVFQQDPRYWPATRNVEKDGKAFFTRLIAADKANPSLKYGDLANAVQNAGPTYPTEVGRWEKTAKTFVDEYGTQGGDTSREVVKKYQFTVGPPDGPKDETFWDAMLRLADQVRWRIFVVGNTLYYVADRDLMASKPLANISEDSNGIDSIDFDIDVHKRNNEATVACQAERWDAPPGSVIKLHDCGPADGRWLVWQIERDIFSPDTTITLKKAQAPKKEPSPEVVSKSRREGDDTVIIGGRIRDIKKIRDRIIAVAERGLREASRLDYAEVRPMPRSLFIQGHVRTDCSGFATLVYKAAGAPDPNGFGYNGSGFTGTLMANGQKVASPKPGDMVFYRSPEHVGIYIGDGLVIEFGGEPGPKKVPVHYRNDIIGYWRFDLGPSNPGTGSITYPIKPPHGAHSPANRGSG